MTATAITSTPATPSTPAAIRSENDNQSRMQAKIDVWPPGAFKTNLPNVDPGGHVVPPGGPAGPAGPAGP
jgi:hypothetical protein